MQKIEDYIEKVYRNFDNKVEETIILKEETRSHLIDEVEEFKKQGLTEEESINKALSNFGSEKAVISEMNLILKKQNKFSNMLKKLTISIFIIACIFYAINYIDGYLHRNENPYIYDNTTAYVLDNIKNKIENKDVLDVELKSQVTQLLDEFNNKTDNGLYYVKIEREGNSSSDYEYKKDVPESMLLGGSGETGIAINGKRIWNIYYNLTYNQADLDIKVHQKLMNRVPYRLYQASNYLFVAFAVLLFVYILNKAYMRSPFSIK